jgi:hypothetical protein
MGKRKKMEIVNTSASGIDIGIRSHFAAVDQAFEDLRGFEVYAEDLTPLCEWLLSYGVTSVEMESTGDY